jgi:hypothetical protein
MGVIIGSSSPIVSAEKQMTDSCGSETDMITGSVWKYMSSLFLQKRIM